MFLALVDDDHHELIPGSHQHSAPYEHDVLLPQEAKDSGVPYEKLWDGQSVLPGVTVPRLQAGECCARRYYHRGHHSQKERLTLAGG